MLRIISITNFTNVQSDLIVSATVEKTEILKEYTLTVLHKYAGAETPFDTETDNVAFGTGYTANAKSIEGYTPDETTKQGIMPVGGAT